MTTTNDTKQELIQYVLDSLDNGYEGTYACDLHNELFNTDYYIIGTYDAKKWLENVGVFEAIETIRQYEQDNFDQVSCDFSNPEKVVNMYVYIIGEEILNESETLRDRWNCRLDADDIAALREEFEQML